MRFSLRMLLVLFTVVAVSVAGLLYANPAWAAFFYTTAFGFVLTGVVGAVVRHGPARGYWIGFAIFGGGYFALALIHENFLLRYAVDRPMGQEPRLATSQLFLWAERYIHRNASGDRSTGFGPGRPATFSMGGVSYVPASPTDYFVEVGHSILTLVLAVIGGWVGKTLYVAPAAGAVTKPESDP
jgi:hypothetical protein